jgi:5-methylcytosine-specific restriction endonuclease McrA
MKSLKRSDEDAWAVFEAIRDAKYAENRGVLVGISDAVRQRYAEYDRHQKNLELIPDAAPPFVAREQRALRDCYWVSTDPLKLLKQRIKGRQSKNAKSTCQYCGIDSPKTWDHYLPGESFPEFSVYPDNLVPCCWRCNSKRGESWREDGERLHINLYFDEVEERERFLSASVYFDEEKLPHVRFHVDPARGANQAFARRYERHCGALGLCERFEESAPAYLDELSAQIRGAARSFAADAAAIALHLRGIAGEYQQLYGANNWQVALLTAVAESREFIEYSLRQASDATATAST